MTPDQIRSMLIDWGVIDPTQIDYPIDEKAYAMFEQCQKSSKPTSYSDGQFCGGIESFVFQHPEDSWRDVRFTFGPDGELIECYSFVPKNGDKS